MHVLVPLTWSPTFADLLVFVPTETIEYPIPHAYSTWSAMLPVFTAAVHVRIPTDHLPTVCCRMGLCARDYGKFMVGNREAKKL